MDLSATAQRSVIAFKMLTALEGLASETQLPII